MPYLHWETSLAHAHMTYVIEDIKNYEFLKTNPLIGSDWPGATGLPNLSMREITDLRCGVDETLLRNYLNRSSPVHIRRTLAQSYYTALANTSVKDQDQVVNRFARAKCCGTITEHPLLMVDQCWLWIIGGSQCICESIAAEEILTPTCRHGLDLLPRTLEQAC